MLAKILMLTWTNGWRITGPAFEHFFQLHEHENKAIQPRENNFRLCEMELGERRFRSEKELDMWDSVLGKRFYEKRFGLGPDHNENMWERTLELSDQGKGKNLKSSWKMKMEQMKERKSMCLVTIEMGLELALFELKKDKDRQAFSAENNSWKVESWVRHSPMWRSLNWNFAIVFLEVSTR